MYIACKLCLVVGWEQAQLFW